MSEHKQEKWLYTFGITQEKEVEKTLEETIDGQVVKVTRKTKEQIRVPFALKKPNRRLYERADLFYGVQLAEGIRAGLLTKALLLKRYRADGGALSENDALYFDGLSKEYALLENEHQRRLANLDKVPEEENQTRIKETYEKKSKILEQLQAFETINRALFAHTAETKADIQLSNWWTVFLAYWDENSDGNFKEFFPGDTFDEKMKHWDVLYEKDERFFLEALARFALTVSFWNAGAQSQNEFEEADKQQFPVITDAPKLEDAVEQPATTPTPENKSEDKPQA